ncbi:hypothetical protein Tco_0336103 [Tanacetum coccineum]
MTTLKFADTHNMVAFLAKPTESEGFDQIVDFLNAHTIKYALTINPTIYTSCIEQFWATVKAKIINGEVQLQALVDGKKIIITELILTLMGYEKISQKLTFYKAFFSPQWKFLIHTILQCLSSKTTAWNEFSSTMASVIICLATNQKFNFSKYIFESMVKNLDNVSGNFLMYPRSRRSKRKETEVPQPSGPTTNVADEAVNEKIDDSLERVATTATGLEAEQDNGDTIAQTRSENVSKHSNDPLLARGNTLQSGEDRLKLKELMALCTTLQSRVLALKTTKTTQSTKIASCSSRRVESFNEEGLGEEDASKQGRIADIDANEDICMVNVQPDEDMFGVNDLDGDEVIVKSVDVNTAKETRSVVEEVTAITIPTSATTTTTTTTAITNVEMTLAQALAELKSAKPKADKVVIQEPEQGASTYTNSLFTTTIIANEEEEERLAKEKAQQVEEANIDWDDVQAKIDADYQLAQRLQAQEQEELTDEEKARLFVQFFEQRRKHFAAKRIKEKRNKPPTRDKQRSIICTYLKNMEEWKPKNLKNKSFANIQELFDKAMKRVNTFVDYRTGLVEESSKKAEAEIAHESSLERAREELEQESSKKQKLEEDKESEELNQCLEIIPYDGDDVTIEATPLSTKSPTIVDYKIYKEGKKSYFQIIRADGNSQMYLTFGKMLKTLIKKTW